MSNIEWTQKTWNPTLGCTEVSPGCTNCYAARMAFRLSHIPAMKEDYADLTMKLDNGKIVWTGMVRVLPERLEEPMNVKKPTTWFVDSMSDLFHPGIPFEFIDKVFVIMKSAGHHTFQILTKRAERMQGYFSDDRPAILDAAYLQMMDLGFKLNPAPAYIQNHGKPYENWPLKNVWLGVSVESQSWGKRIENLMRCPAAIRFISAEPLVGPLDITNKGLDNAYSVPTKHTEINGKKVGIQWTDPGDRFIGLDWVIVGGESGPGARPVNPDWVRSLRDQCRFSKVPFFFKQWGEYLPHDQMQSGQLDFAKGVSSSIPPGFNTNVLKVGKKLAGRRLDGVIHNQFPLKK